MTTPQPVNEYRYHENDAQADPRLNGLLAQFDAAKDQFDAAKKAFDAIKDELKAVLTSGVVMRDGAPYNRYVLDGPDLVKPVTLRWTVRDQLDGKGLRQQFPDIAEQFTSQRGSWTMERQR